MADEAEKVPGEDPVVTLARKRFAQALEAEGTNREKQRDDMKFLAATPDDAAFQWPSSILSQRTTPGQAGFIRPTLTINKMRPHQNQVLNEQRMNRPQFRVRPSDSKASKEVAKALNGWLRHIQVASEADLAWDIACQWQTGAGEGYVRMHTAYADEMSQEQEVVIAPCPDRFKVYLDPIGLRLHPAGRKCRWGFIVEDLPKEEYEELHGKDHSVDWTLAGIGDEQKHWFEAGKSVRVAEYFEIKETAGILCEWKDPQGEVVNALKGSPEEARYIAKGWVATGKQRPTKVPRCVWRRMNGQKVIAGPKEMPTRFIPIIRVVGNEFVVDGETFVDGMVRPAKDAQRMYNYNRSKEVEVNALAPLAPITAAVDQIKGHESIYEKANNVPVGYLPYNLIRNDDESIVAIAAPARIQPPMPPAALIQGSMNADQDIKATMNQWGPALGEPSPEKSGKAINARKVESDVGNFHYVDNLARAYRFAGAIALDMAPEIIDSRMIVRILGEDGEPDHIVVDPDSPVPYKEEPDPDGKIVKIYNFAIGRYEVLVDTGPNFTTRRAEAAEFLSSSVQSAKDPATANVLAYLAMRNQDWAGAEEAVTLLKTLLPPQAQQALQQDDGAPKIPPEVQATMDQLKGALGHMKGQLDAAQQALQERDQKVRDLDSQVKGKSQDAMARMYDADMKALAEVTRARAEVLIAQAKALEIQAEQPDNAQVQAVTQALGQFAGEMDAKIAALAESAQAIRNQLDTFEIAGRMPQGAPGASGAQNALQNGGQA